MFKRNDNDIPRSKSAAPAPAQPAAASSDERKVAREALSQLSDGTTQTQLADTDRHDVPAGLTHGKAERLEQQQAQAADVEAKLMQMSSDQLDAAAAKMSRGEAEKLVAEQRLKARELDTEPTFMLRANDIVAVHAVRYWADLAEAMAAPADKVSAARQVAAEMREWQNRNGCKVPD